MASKAVAAYRLKAARPAKMASRISWQRTAAKSLAKIS